MAVAGRDNCRDVMAEASAELKSMCNELGMWVYVLDNCFDPPDTPLARFLDDQPRRSIARQRGLTQQ
eukprot:3867224-Prorocentrum_lima.AAC.1